MQPVGTGGEGGSGRTWICAPWVSHLTQPHCSCRILRKIPIAHWCFWGQDFLLGTEWGLGFCFKTGLGFCMGETVTLWLPYREAMACCRNIIYYLLPSDGLGIRHFIFTVLFNPPNTPPNGNGSSLLQMRTLNLESWDYFCTIIASKLQGCIQALSLCP